MSPAWPSLVQASWSALPPFNRCLPTALQHALLAHLMVSGQARGPPRLRLTAERHFRDFRTRGGRGMVSNREAKVQAATTGEGGEAGEGGGELTIDDDNHN
ncbi:hypothetical protein JDV02_003762 [Purpureocillium takamizusanense]|uniref:Uncharacterized protein n=1 Tax=Purpureocillium takamizusanense TaxID=2060973 RepID=A0A9Q8VA15_9HYPO|nr:uncharacterized protein JDV02_003762 [Purpureocillium takamizusanense]UNI17419.1 hypothetical protein JDV02_003762 [Purpureocillium takamizusanense]